MSEEGVQLRRVNQYNDPTVTPSDTAPAVTPHTAVTNHTPASHPTPDTVTGDSTGPREVTDFSVDPPVTSYAPNSVVPLQNGSYVNKAFEAVDLDTPTDIKHTDGPSGYPSADPRHVPEPSEEPPSGCLGLITVAQVKMEQFFTGHTHNIKFAIGLLILLGYGAYFGYAMWYSLEGEDQIRLLWITVLAAVLCSISLFRRTCGDATSKKVIRPINNFVLRHFTIFKWGLILAFVVFVITFLVIEVVTKRPRNLVSLSGYVVFILLLFLMSSNPSQVQWRPVCWGLAMQFVFALLTLRTPWGLAAFQWLGERVSEFLVHTDAGSKFVFGDSFEDHRFAFKVLPVVVFFSAVISTLYYLGVMQVVILKLAWVMSRVMGTTAGESVNAAGNIFIGQTEAPLLIRPLIDDMSPSELHAVMTGGYATIAGSVMASFIMFGVKANHLITASVMAAPCALALSKLSYPENDKEKCSGKNLTEMEKPPQRNVIEAVSAGASAAISLVANIAANLIAFMALLAFINATLQWFGARVGLTPPDYPPLTFQLICSYVMWPVAFLMGVDVSNCRKVGELIGFKIFINEFVAYTELGKLIANRQVLDAYTGAWNWVNGDIVMESGRILIGGVMTPRSEVICTYALCGFANLSSIGMVMGALGSMSEKQRPVVARLAFRAMVVGTTVSLVNACAAGLLYEGS